MKKMKNMKKLTLAALAAFLFMAPALSGAADAERDKMLMEMGQDTRTELRLPPPMKVKQKAMMREHLDSLSEITAALAADDLDKASTVAKDKLGWNFEEERKCEQVAMMSGEDDFLTLGKAMHTEADALADAARFGDRDKALEHLASLMKSCNACHQRYRH